MTGEAQQQPTSGIKRRWRLVPRLMETPIQAGVPDMPNLDAVGGNEALNSTMGGESLAPPLMTEVGNSEQPQL